MASIGRRRIFAFILALALLLGLLAGCGVEITPINPQTPEAEDTPKPTPKLSPEETAKQSIMETFAKFNTALQEGDIQTLTALFPPWELDVGEIPLFGSLDDMREYLNGDYASYDFDVDFTSDSTMVRSYIQGLRLSFSLRGPEDVELSADGQSAVLTADENYFYDGQKQRDVITFYALKQDRQWYISLSDEDAGPPAPEETTPPAGGVDVGVVLPTKDEPRWLQDEAKFNEALAATPYTAEILFSQGDSSLEKANVESLIARGVKVLIICPQDSQAAAAAVEEAKAAGVKIISYDRLVTNTSAVDYYVAFDSVSIGEAQGQYLADNVTGAGNPLYLYAGAISDINAFLFFQGAWNALQPKIADGTFMIMNSSVADTLTGKSELSSNDQAAILSQITTQWDPDKAQKLAENDVAAYPPPSDRPVYILGPNDGTAVAIADAFAVIGNPYYLTGQDAWKESVQSIIDGKQSMTVFKDTRTMAQDAVDMAVALLGGGIPVTTGSYNNGFIDVPVMQVPLVVVTRDNVKAALIDSGYYSASDFNGI